MLLIRIHLCIPPDATTELDSVARVLERLQKSNRGRAKLKPVLWHDLPLDASAALENDVAVVLSDDHGVDLSVFVLGESLGLDGELRQPNEDGEPYGSAVEAEFALMTTAHAASPDGLPLILVYRRRVLRPVGLLLEEDDVDASPSEPTLTPAEEADTPVGVFAEGALAAAAGSLAANERFDGPADLEALLELHLGHCLQTLLGADAEAPDEELEGAAVAAGTATAMDVAAELEEVEQAEDVEESEEAGDDDEPEAAPDDEDALEWDEEVLDLATEDKYRVVAEQELAAADDAADSVEELLSLEEISSQIAAKATEGAEVDAVAEDDEDEVEEDEDEVDPENFEATIPTPKAEDELDTDAAMIEQAFAARARGQEAAPDAAPAPSSLPGESAAQDATNWKLIAAVLVLIAALFLFADGFRQRKLAADATEAADHAREASQAAREQADALAGPQGDAVALPNEFITLPGDPTNIVPPELPPTEAALAADLAATREDLGQALLKRSEAYSRDFDHLRAALAAERAMGFATTGWRTDAPRLLSPLTEHSGLYWPVRTLVSRQTLCYPQALVTSGFPIGSRAVMAASPTAKVLAVGDGSLELWNLTTGRLEATLMERRVSSLGFSADGATLMAATDDGGVYVWNMATRQARLVFSTQHREHLGLTLSPDGRTIAVVTSSGPIAQAGVELRSAATGKLEQVLSTPNSAPSAPRFSPDGRFLAYTSGTRLFLWTLATRTPVLASERVGRGLGQWAWAPDSRQLAVVTSDGGVALYDVASGKTNSGLSKALGQHRAGTVAWIPGGSLLAVGCKDGSVQTVDTATSKLQAPFEGLGDEATTLQPSHDGQLLVAKSRNAAPRVWDVATRQPIGLYSRQSGPMKIVVYSPDRTLVATASDESELRLWEAETGRQVASFGNFSKGGVFAMAFDKAGSRVVTLAHPGQVTVWETRTGKVLSRRTLPNWTPLGNSISADASRIAYVNQSQECVVSNVADGTQAVIRKVTDSGVWTSTALSRDGDQLVISQGDAPIELWDVNRQNLLRELDEPSHLAILFAFSGDGKRLALRAKDGAIHLWDLPNNTLVDRFTIASPPAIVRLALNHDGSQAAMAVYGGDLFLWEPGGDGGFSRLAGHRNTVTDLAFRGDGLVLASGDKDGDLRLWNTAPSLALDDLPGHVQYITDLAIDEKGETLASASHDGTIRLWDFRTGKADHILHGFHGTPKDMAFVPRLDGQKTQDLAVIDQNGHASLIVQTKGTSQVQRSLPDDAGSFTDVHPLRRGEVLLSGPEAGLVVWLPVANRHYTLLPGSYADVAVSPGKDKLAVHDGNRTVRIYAIDKLRSAQTPRLQAELTLPRRGVGCFAFSVTGQTLAVGDIYGSVRLYNSSTGKPLGEIRGHSNMVFDLAFSPNRKHLASASADGTIRLMDLGGGRKTTVLTGHEGGVRAIRFSPGGRVLVSAGNDSMIRYWDANTGRLLRILSADPDTSTVANPPAGTDTPAAANTPADATAEAPATTEDALPGGVTEQPTTPAADPAAPAPMATADDDAPSTEAADTPDFDISAHSGLYTQIPAALLAYRFEGADVHFTTAQPNLYIGGLGYHRRFGYTLPPEAELTNLPAPVRAELDALVQADLAWRRSHDWPAPRSLPGALVEPRAAPIVMPVEFVDHLLQQDAEAAAALDTSTPAPPPAPAPEATPTTD